MAIDKAKTTTSGGVHLGPDPKKQADFPPQEVGARSAQAAMVEQQRTHHSGVSAVGGMARGGNDYASAASGEVSVSSSVVMDTTQTQNVQASSQIQSLLSRLSSTTSQVDEVSLTRRQHGLGPGPPADEPSPLRSSTTVGLDTGAEEDADAPQPPSERTRETRGAHAAPLRSCVFACSTHAARTISSARKQTIAFKKSSPTRSWPRMRCCETPLLARWRSRGSMRVN